MKRGLTDDNPVYEVRSFSVQLIEWEKDLIDLADKLHEKWCNVTYHTFGIFLFEIESDFLLPEIFFEFNFSIFFW